MKSLYLSFSNFPKKKTKNRNQLEIVVEAIHGLHPY